jgi:hypothetical protein
MTARLLYQKLIHNSKKNKLIRECEKDGASNEFCAGDPRAARTIF